MDSVERIEHNGKLLALILREKFNQKGLTFLTKDNCSLQLGVHLQNKDYESKPHRHIPFENIEKLNAEEIFFVVNGKIIVGLFTDEGKKISDIERAQVINYLKATGLNLGLLMNFGSSSLEVKRLINTNP